MKKTDLQAIGSDELIYIETEKICVTLKGVNTHPDFCGVKLNNGQSNIRVQCDDDYIVNVLGEYVPETKIITGFSFSGEINISPLFFEQQRYELIIESVGENGIEFWHENYNIRNKISPVGRNSKMLSGIICFGNEIGLSDLIVLVDGKKYLCLTIEVFPTKISYKEDYQAILADVISEIYNIVFDFLKSTYSEFGLSEKKDASPVEFFAIIKKIFDDYIRAVDMILSAPHHELKTDYAIMAGHKVKRTDNRSIRWLQKHPEQLQTIGNRYVAKKALAVLKNVSYDTEENRLTKFILKKTMVKLMTFKKNYALLYQKTDNAVFVEIDRMISMIEQRINSSVLINISDYNTPLRVSLVFSMASGYRDLYKYYLMLQRGLSVTGDVFSISVKDLALLYEYWCFIKLNSLMRNEKYELVSQDIINVRGNGLFISLVKGKKSQVKYRSIQNGEIITLSYNPKRAVLPTVSQRPDNVLTLEKKGTDKRYEYVFDAKYRIDPALSGTYYHQNYHFPGPKEEDINTMHRYRDAIVSESGSYQRTMFGAYVLFPLSKELLSEDDYKQHHFYQSIEKVNIGGLPFLPSATTLVESFMDELIKDSPDSAFERATLPLGIEEKMQKVDWEKRDVLVGTLKNKVQFDICYEHLFYHVPKKKISSERLPIRYIALYQSKNLFGEKACIQYYGEVLNYRIVKRKEITEIPRDSEEAYYRFEIKDWKQLPRPITIKESSGLFLFTNLFLLQHSSETPELKIRSEEAYRLYSELKRALNHPEVNENPDEAGFKFGKATIMFDNGKILLYNDRCKNVFSKYEINAFLKKPGAVFKQIKRDLEVIDNESNPIS